jgi:soluble lytic murein transglycosylase-like protein
MFKPVPERIRFAVIALLLAAVGYCRPSSAESCRSLPYSKTLVLEVASKYKLDPLLLKAIVVVESSGKLDAYNAKTRDYGLMQINSTTAAGMGLNKDCLMRNARYSLEAGAKVLTYMRDRFASKESRWLCRYNVGTGVISKYSEAGLARDARCRAYYAKVMDAYKRLEGVMYVAEQ